eukprot:jgi/Chlat1/6948/Chrsp52S06614
MAARKSYWSSLFKRERFSLEELRHLHEQLSRITVVTEYNKDGIVETLRSIAELMIWGDQHEPSFFDFFLEKQFLGHFLRIVSHPANRKGGVAVQMLQTLSIMIQNIRSETAIYYLFSNNHINDLIEYRFDFTDEELLAYYISFLRTISLKLNERTVQFFFRRRPDGKTTFPLYTEAIKFFRHEEGMVRIAVRTLTLNVYSVHDEAVQRFAMSNGPAHYFEDVVKYVRQQCFALDDLLHSGRNRTKSTIEGAVAELLDLLHYCSDILKLGIPDLCTMFTGYLIADFIRPQLLCSLAPMLPSSPRSPPKALFEDALQMADNHELSPDVKGDASLGSVWQEDGCISSLLALFLLSRLVHTIRFGPLLDAIMQQLTHCPDAKDSRSKPQSFRAALLDHLRHHSEKHVQAALCVLIALMRSKDIDHALLDAAGLLPLRQRSKNLLLQALTSSEAEEQLTTLFVRKDANGAAVDTSSRGSSLTESPAQEPGHQRGDSTELGTTGSERFFDALSLEDDAQSSTPTREVPNSGYMSSDAAIRSRNEIVELLVGLVSSSSPPSAPILWCAGWLLRHLLHNGGVSTGAPTATPVLQQLLEAHAASRARVWSELEDIWCDTVAVMVREEWGVCRKHMQSPLFRNDSATLLLPDTAPSVMYDDKSSAAAAERMITAIKVFVALHQLRLWLANGSVPEQPPLPPPSTPILPETASAPDTPVDVKEGTEVPLASSLHALPCRVAFERGRERSVYLVVVPAAMPVPLLVLAEPVPTRLNCGVVRAVAPLVGAQPTVDREHPKWLHLVVRSPLPPRDHSIEVGGGQMFGGARRRLSDGRWTVAFSDEEKSANAFKLVIDYMGLLQSSTKQAFAPMLQDSLATSSMSSAPPSPVEEEAPLMFST